MQIENPKIKSDKLNRPEYDQTTLMSPQVAPFSGHTINPMKADKYFSLTFVSHMYSCFTHETEIDVTEDRGSSAVIRCCSDH